MVTVSVRLFATLREQAGWSEKEVAIAEGTKLAGLLTRLEEDEGLQLRGRPVYAAVNQEYADSEKQLNEGDVVALFPPVSGGCY